MKSIIYFLVILLALVSAKADIFDEFGPPRLLTATRTRSWTPTLIGSTGGGPPTYAVQVGSWELINRQVTLRFVISTSSLGAVTGLMQIGGLPLSAANIASDNGFCTINATVGVTLDAGYTTLAGNIQPNTNVITLTENGSGQTNQAPSVARFAAATTLQGFCSYHI